MNIRLPFDREAWKFAGIAAIIAVLLGHIGPNIGWIGFILTIGCLLFFRDPERVPPSRKSVIVSPADGTVLKISEVDPSPELEIKGKHKKISIFMSVFNVHVNRSPAPGVVDKIIYVPGKFLNASLDKSSEYNERQIIHMNAETGIKFVFVQIAGLIARRIRCDISEGQELELGDRVGIIRFGSRVDVYLPDNARILVEEGQTMIAGETVIADFKIKEIKEAKEIREEAKAKDTKEVKEMKESKKEIKEIKDAKGSKEIKEVK